MFRALQGHRLFDPSQPITLPLAGCAAKLDQALGHLQHLAVAVQNGPNGDGNRFLIEPDPEVGDDVVRLRLEDFEPMLWAVLIGDCIHNLRSSLDHLAYQLALAEAGPLPPDVERSSEFPIFDDPDDFKRVRSKGALKGEPNPGSGFHKIRGMHSDAQDLIEGLQPYHGGDRKRLWMLQQLSIMDKHRVTLLADLGAAGWGFNPIPASPGERMSFQVNYIQGVVPDALEHGAIVARVSIDPIPPSTEVNYDLAAQLQISFKRPVDAAGLAVVDTLADIRDYIISDVLPPLERFVA